MWFKCAELSMALEFIKRLYTTWTLSNNMCLECLSMKRRRDFQRLRDNL